jgi:hypothetical protein
MSAFFYYLATAAGSVLSVFGVRGTYEQPHYAVVGHLNDDVEVRTYRQRVEVQTAMRQGNDGEAFGRLARYITGDNQGHHHIPMTVPVEMTGTDSMRFFMPRAGIKAGPPAPTDPDVHIVTLPPQSFAVLRFSGTVDDASRAAHEKALLNAVRGAGRQPEGTPLLLSYDPPFAIPFLRRNEIAVALAAP